MRGNGEVTRELNALLKCQLTAINQFFLHARILRNWGLEELNEKEYGYSIEAMKTADAVIERVLFLEELPNLQDLGKLMIGEDVSEILKHDLALQTANRGAMVDAIARCENVQDYVSRDLVESMLGKVEEHIDWLETQNTLVNSIGLENYLQSMM